MKPKTELEHEPEPTELQFKPDTDICQQLMSRYSASTAPQHRHLLATAAAIQSILTAENLPLNPASYFAAAIDNLADSEALDSTAVAALVSLVTIVVAVGADKEIGVDKAREAVEVLVGVVERREGLSVASVRGVVKCLGALVCGFCELEKWDEVKNGFQGLIKFATDKRPKVRRCAQECLEKVFKSSQSSAIIKQASKLVLSLLKTHMPVALKLSDLKIVDGSKDDALSEPEQLEVLHMLNLLNLTVPHLLSKISSKILSKLLKLMSSQYSPLTRHIFKIIEAFFEVSRDKVIVPHAEKIIDSLCLYISYEGNNPMDTVITGASLLKLSLDILHAGQTISWTRNMPKVCSCLAGLLTYDTGTASQISEIIKKIVDQHIDQKLLLMEENQSFEDLHQKHVEAGPIQSFCAVFENILTSSDGIPNEHLLGVLSALFLKLGKISFVYMKSIVLKLADFMNHAISNELATCHLRSCIGSAVGAMGPDRILSLIPISVNADDFTSVNTWLAAILKDSVVGASLDYYLQHIVPLAKSFQEASVKAKNAVTRQDLQTHAQSLWGLLPAFCHYPVDTHINFKSLAELLIAFLKEDSFMHQHTCVALQMLVKQNKSVLVSRDNLVGSDSNTMVGSALQSRSLPSYHKKVANLNIKALSSCSKELLHALTDLFIDSPPEKRIYIKDAIGCLASITDSSIIRKLFIKKSDFTNNKGEFDNQKSHTDGELIDKTSRKDVPRHVMLQLTSSFIEGAEDHLTDLIYNFIIYIFKATDVTEHCEAYYTLSKILEEHTSFCSSRLMELMDLIIGLKAPTDVMSLRSRFACVHKLMVQSLQRSLEEEDTRAFHFLNEIIITLKDTKEDTRKVAYDALLLISSSLRSSSPASVDVSYSKLISMIMGYLSGSSPHIKSGAVSALSVLVHNDVDISLEVPDLVSSILSLLKTKTVEVTKAALGFVKVLMSCLPAKDMRNFLSDIMDGILPLSSVSRFHFRSKVIVILEIMIRKCGFAVIESNTPEKYKSFVKTVSQNRHHRSTCGEAGMSKMERQHSSTKRPEKQKQKKLETLPEGKDSSHLRKRKREKKQHGEPHMNDPRDGGGFERSKKARISKDEKPRKTQDKHVKKRTFNKEPKSGGGNIEMQKQIGKREKVAVKRAKSASKFHKHQRDAKKQKT